MIPMLAACRCRCDSALQRLICQPLKSIRSITSDYPRKASSRHLVDLLHHRRPRNLIPFSVFPHTNRVGPNRRRNPCHQWPILTHTHPLRKRGHQTRYCATDFIMRHPASGIPVQSSAGCFHARLSRERGRELRAHTQQSQSNRPQAIRLFDSHRHSSVTSLASLLNGECQFTRLDRRMGADIIVGLPSGFFSPSIVKRPRKR